MSEAGSESPTCLTSKPKAERSLQLQLQLVQGVKNGSFGELTHLSIILEVVIVVQAQLNFLTPFLEWNLAPMAIPFALEIWTKIHSCAEFVLAVVRLAILPSQTPGNLFV